MSQPANQTPSNPPGSNGPTAAIAVRIRELSQLFNSLDPSPFRERDLDPDAEEHIVEWARELQHDGALTIIVHLPDEEARKARERGLPAAIANYFAYRAEQQDRAMRELFRNGRRYLGIGIPLLLACLAASQLLRALLPEGTIARTLEESLIILGWVANWKPLETFLYDWLPMKRNRDLYRRLAAAAVEIRTQA